MIDLIKFILFVIFFLYIPPKIIFKLLDIDFEDRLIDIGLSISLGIALITLLSLAIRFLGGSFSLLWPILIFSLAYSLKFRSSINLMNLLSRQNLFILAVILIGVITQNLVLFRGGWQTDAGLVFPSIHDTMWNIAISNELFYHFPPQNPAVSGVVLKNNHYFYPFFLSIARFITGIDIFDLYFRLVPPVVSALFGLGLYAVGSIYIKNLSFRVLCVFLGFFSGNFAYLLPFFLGAKVDWKGNSFFADQPFDQITNPYSILGFVLMLFGIYGISQIGRKKKTAVAYSLIAGIFFGVLYGFKSFGGILAIISLSIFFMFILFKYRKISYLPLVLTSTIIFLGVFFLTTDVTSASLVFAPGWLLTQMIADKDKIFLPQLVDIESYYKTIGNYLGLLKIRTVELFIYLVGNLGTRIIGVIYLIYILFHIRPDKQKYIFQFIGIAVFVSLTIPLLFNLRNSPFNIIQFTPYALVLTSLLSVICLGRIYEYLKGRGKKIIGIALVLLFIILSIPVNVKNIISKLEAPKELVTYEELKALEFLREETKLSDIILIDPKNFSVIVVAGKKISQDPIYVSLLSSRRVYLASHDYALQTGIDPTSREKEINDLSKLSKSDFLEKNKIKYIYLIKANLFDDQVNHFNALGFTQVFENERVIIFKTKAE